MKTGARLISQGGVSREPDLPGVVATGDTLEECEAEVREAIEVHIE